MHKDGQPRNVSLTVSLIKTPDGQVTGVSGILRDITDRKRLEHSWPNWPSEERRRIGQELHDSLGQQMSALGMLAPSLQQTLKAQSSPELACISRLVQGIEDAKTNIRALSQGLLPVGIDAEGLMNALRELTTPTRGNIRHGVHLRLPAAGPHGRQHNGHAPVPYRAGVDQQRGAACPSETDHCQPARRGRSHCRFTMTVSGCRRTLDGERQRLADHAISRRLDRGHTLRHGSERWRHARYLLGTWERTL